MMTATCTRLTATPTPRPRPRPEFPGREFDDLDEYRAAKKQRAEFRAAYYADNNPKYNPPRNTH